MSRLLLLVLAAGTASAAPPVASYLFPAGGQRGTAVPVRVGGLFVHDSCGFALDGGGVKAVPELKPGKRVWFEGPIIPLPDSQQAEDYPVDMLGSVEIDAKAAAGARRARIWTSQGVATGPLFVVGDTPEVVETEIDGDPIPESVTPPVTANGRIFPREDVDLWAVKLTKGQTLSALATTTGIRSPLVAKLEVVSAKGDLLARSGTRTALGADASVRFTAPADGTYHVRITDARGQGGPAFVYRLTMTTDPVVDSVFPLGGKRGETVKLNGGTAVAIPADAPAAWPTRLGSQSITLDTDDLPEFVSAPTNPVAPPAVFNGRIEPAAVEAWKVELKKAKKYDLELRAKKLGSPLCGTLAVLDADGKDVAKMTPDDPGTDPLVSFQPAADGVYTVRVAERFRNRGGADFGYRLRVRESTPAAPDFALKLAADSANVPRGGSVKWKLTADRIGGLIGAIEVSVAGLPAGVSCAKATIPAGQSLVELTLSAEALAQVAVGTVSVTGTAKVGDTPATRTATPPDGGAAYVAVAVPTPFAIDGVYTMSNAPRGQPYSRRYSLKRNGFDGPVEIRLADRQARHLQGVTGPTVRVPAGVGEFEYAVQLPAWVEIGRTSRTCLMAVGTVTDPDGTKHRVCHTTTETNYQLIVVPEPGRLGIDLTKEAAVAAPGDTLRIPFVISRAKGMMGEVKVECVLPDHWRGVTAEAVTVAADKTDGELVLKIGKDAAGPFNMPATVRATSGVVVAEAKVELIGR